MSERETSDNYGWKSPIHDNGMTLDEMRDDFSLNLIEHIGHLQEEVSFRARDIDAFFEFVFSEKITEMRSVLP